MSQFQRLSQWWNSLSASARFFMFLWAVSCVFWVSHWHDRYEKAIYAINYHAEVTANARRLVAGVDSGTQEAAPEKYERAKRRLATYRPVLDRAEEMLYLAPIYGAAMPIGLPLLLLIWHRVRRRSSSNT